MFKYLKSKQAYKKNAILLEDVEMCPAQMIDKMNYQFLAVLQLISANFSRKHSELPCEVQTKQEQPIKCLVN